MTNQPDDKPPTFLQTIASVGASFFGVQSSKNRERDFKRGNPATFIAIALVGTVLFVLTLVIVVKIALHRAGM